MSDKKLDEFFKESFSGYSPDVPAHIWENIAAGKKKKRPAAFWLNNKAAVLLLAGIVLLGGGAYFAFNKKDNTQNIALENNGSRKETGNTSPAAVLPADSAQAPANNSNRINTTGGDKNTGGSESINGTKANTIATAMADPLAENAGNKSGATTSPAYKKITASRQSGRTKHNRQEPVYSKSNGNYTITVDANEPGEEGIDEAANSNETGTAPALPYMDGIKKLMLLAAESNLPKTTIQPFVPAVKISEECPGAPAKKYYFDAYISPDYAIKKYADTGTSSLVAKRKESLRFQSAFSAGLRYTRVFNNGMSIRTGINFSQINEKFSYAQENVVQLVYVINMQGDTTDSYYVRGTRYKNSYNHYRTIDVPLLVGYEMGNDKLRANINAGAMINIYSWQKGETLDNNGNPVTITTGKPENPYQYKTNVGIGFTAGASFYYKLNNKLYALAEPYFRYNFSPMNKEVLSIQERFTTVGLRLGIRLDIK